ncbi:hypothetical protein V6N13_052541 [Hibiscus sabdariffa]|uniref:Uncharacterized protein n=1 Tax=Hibiscus sabdariffa TaxID=183260 RepID=A0ABR2Q4M8_9ROSI
MEDSTETHAVLLSSPGLGHLTPVLELGKHLWTLNFKQTKRKEKGFVSVAAPVDDAEGAIDAFTSNPKAGELMGFWKDGYLVLVGEK